MGSRVQSTVGCFPELYFRQFSVAHVLVGLQKGLLGPLLLVLIIIQEKMALLNIEDLF